MISADQAITNLKRKYPDRKVVGVYDYDSHWWLLEAINSDEIDYDDPFYAVNKQSGAVKSYAPGADIQNFSKALKKSVNF